MKVFVLLSLIVLVSFPSQAQAQSCSELPAKLEACQVYECEFKHPFTGSLMKKGILGIKEGKCHYFENMPNGGRMDCHYNEEYRKVVAKFYSDWDKAQTKSFKANVSIGKQKDAKSTYTINGKEYSNPIQEAMNNKICLISGY